MPTSSRQGVSGACLVRVLQGQPDQRESYLTSGEQGHNDQFLPCCARTKWR
ncbi:2Fe-2S iron-sulfur cluster-binding protein [Variovorax sp. RCC_210]|uniref:2Fe-2S iron-sulfur cluster-binding protein n=1 Tax=Variovorax sp. RCC_210 TaxID=3239217 RepID=UPI003523E4D0